MPIYHEQSAHAEIQPAMKKSIKHLGCILCRFTIKESRSRISAQECGRGCSWLFGQGPARPRGATSKVALGMLYQQVSVFSNQSTIRLPSKRAVRRMPTDGMYTCPQLTAPVTVSPSKALPVYTLRAMSPIGRSRAAQPSSPAQLKTLQCV